MAEMDFTACASLFSRYHLSLSMECYEKLNRYAQMLTDESRVQNVTAVHGNSDIWCRHFLDSAYILNRFPDGASVIDIGTGGGIPGIPLAILNPTLQITLLDSELRKIEFCERAIAALELSVRAICGRAEELAASAAYREQYDFAVSRAMAAGSMLSELAMPFLRVGGTLIAMKGRNYDPNFERFESAIPLLGGVLHEAEQYSIEGEQKALIAADKIEPTDLKYPRRFAKIKRNPL